MELLSRRPGARGQKEGLRPLLLSILEEKPIGLSALLTIADQGSLSDPAVGISCDHFSLKHIVMLAKYPAQNTLQHFHFSHLLFLRIKFFFSQTKAHVFQIFASKVQENVSPVIAVQVLKLIVLMGIRIPNLNVFIYPMGLKQMNHTRAASCRNADDAMIFLTNHKTVAIALTPLI
jgi:hypothetical protein